ncbi:MAG: aldo/keto reductase [Acidobacteriota bacterium]|nr:aldo/keto reductase [Acidobacteriota bacterium]
MSRKNALRPSVSRRQFLFAGGAAAAATGLPRIAGAEEEQEKPKIKKHRTLGRTGFEVSDISIGGAGKDANVYRYAYDHGINYFDTGESYGNGDSERKIGEALQHMDRKKVFITTKMVLKDGDTQQTFLDRFGKCQERLRTDYIDSLFIHQAMNVSALGNEAFHAASKRLKADGRLRFTGVSNHGSFWGDDKENMEEVLVAAAEDGRFDLMLIAYNFMNRDKGDKVLAACKKNNVGTTAMKTAPGTMKMDPFDPENPSEDYAKYIKRQVEKGKKRDDVTREIQDYIAESETAYANAKPFMEAHGLNDRDGLATAAVKWVLSNPDMQSVCITLQDFDAIDRYVPLSGTTMTRAQLAALDSYRVAASRLYCRHACSDCFGACPKAIPVSTVMRYAYYFTEQAREKHAMSKYYRLGLGDELPCESCSAPCAGACPFGVNIKANLLAAHGLLTLA